MPSGRKILTAAEKEERRNLKAKEKALENQRLIAAGNDQRRSKEKAYENTVWTKGKVDEQNAYDANKGRKRASSTVQSSEKTKKPKQCQPQVEQERLSEDEDEVPPKPKKKSRPPRAAVIDESDDEGAAQEAKPAAKASKAPSAATATKSKKSKTTATKLKPNIIAEGVSDESAADYDDGSDEDSEEDEEGDDEEAPADPRLSSQLDIHVGELLHHTHSIPVIIDPPTYRCKKRTESDHEMRPSKPDSLFDDDVIVHRSDNAPDFSDEDVLIPSAPRRSASRASSIRASSIRSLSSGAGNIPETDYDDHPPDDDVDMEDHDEKESVAPPSPPPKKHKEKSARERKADKEKPHVQPMVKPEDSRRPRQGTSKLPPPTQDRPEHTFHNSARVGFPPLGKDFRLADQTPEMRTVLINSIELVRKHGLLDNAYPPAMKSRAGYAKQVMLQAAQGHSAAEHIVARLKEDPRLSRWLGNLVTDRLSTLRSGAKTRADNIVAGSYGFGHFLHEGDIKNLVNEKIQEDKFIFPYDDTKEEWFTNGDLAVRYRSYFKGRRAKHEDDLEMPDTIIALAATAIFCSLSQYQLTGKKQTIKFNESVYETTYRNHLATIAKTRAGAKNATAILMHNIFKDVTQLRPGSGVPSTGGTLISMVEVPDSD
ncbi:hypothetical protein B0H14DRAFT_3512659 [Mycena olivaceomarginata]|nr:hypothetical protein B0H14DRAFT_3512659 [Mycena olivaceomarginata]